MGSMKEEMITDRSPIPVLAGHKSELSLLLIFKMEEYFSGV